MNINPQVLERFPALGKLAEHITAAGCYSDREMIDLEMMFNAGGRFMLTVWDAFAPYDRVAGGPLTLHAFDAMTEPELKRFFNGVAELIMMSIPEATGFILLCSPLGENHLTQYVANIEREGAIEMLKGFIERTTGGEDVGR